MKLTPNLVDLITVLVAVCVIGVLFAALTGGGEGPIRHQSEWVEVQHESGTTWVIRKSAITGFKLVEDPNTNTSRNEIIYGSRSVKTDLDLLEFKRIFGVQ